MNEPRLFNIAVTTWAIFAVTLISLLILRPGNSLLPLYAEASYQFWSGVLPPSDYGAGYFYLPMSQILFSPITMMSTKVGGAVAQLISLALITWAAWELTRLLVPVRTKLAFSIVLLLIISGVAGILRIIQLDALMWALTAIGASAIARQRAGAAAIAIALAFAFKPTAIVAVLLMGTVWPRVGVRLIPLVVFVLIGPFLFADSGYVVQLYNSLLDRIGGGIQHPRNFMDVGNMLNQLGVPVPFAAMLAIRASVAPATLGIAYAARRKLELPFAAFLTFAFSALYLLLFNPRTEGGGYAGLSLVAAPIAARMILIEGRRKAAIALACVCVSMGITSLTYSTMMFFGSGSSRPWAFWSPSLCWCRAAQRAVLGTCGIDARSSTGPGDYET